MHLHQKCHEVTGRCESSGKCQGWMRKGMQVWGICTFSTPTLYFYCSGPYQMAIKLGMNLWFGQSTYSALLVPSPKTIDTIINRTPTLPSTRATPQNDMQYTTLAIHSTRLKCSTHKGLNLIPGFHAHACLESHSRYKTTYQTLSL
jgi:hypothetical protein